MEKKLVALCVALFMTACLIFVGCSNTASSSGASSTMTEAEAIAAIKALPNGGSITIKLGSSVKTISTGLKNALSGENKKVVLDLSESGVDISVDVSPPYSNALFYDCKSLVDVKLPNGAKKIGWFTFSGCSSLRSVEIPSSVTSIGQQVFNGCSSLTSVIIPDSVTSIDHNAFKNCSALTSVEIPSSVTRIGASAFDGCTALTSVIIPDSVTETEYRSFAGCTSLREVTISKNVRIICDFSGCTSLETIKFTGTKDEWNNKSSVWAGWRYGVPALGVTCSDGKKYKFVGNTSEPADSKLGDEI